MTDPQTAADAAERVQTPAANEAARRGQALVEAFPHSPGWYLLPYEPADLLWNGNGAVHQFTLADLGALLEDRVRMAAKLEQVRELVELLRRARAKLHLERDQAREELEQFRSRQLEWSVLHVSGRDGPLGETDARRFAAQAAPAGARLQNRAVGEWHDVSAASAAPDATGDTQTREQRADGLRDLTKLEGAQRGSQGRAEFERFLTDASRRAVAEFFAEASQESDDFDIDAVIAQNHADAARDWGLDDGPTP